jgi:hypothetical protein
MADILLGYELEFASRIAPWMMSQELMHLRLPRGVVKGWEEWQLGRDDSIRHPEGFFPYEISSAVMPLEKGMDKLSDMLKWMQDIHVHTNNTTGIHINLSWEDPEKMKKMDQLKLVLFLNEDEILRQFQRSRNGFCQGHQGVLRYKCFNGEITTREQLDSELLYEKDMFVNLSKTEDGYLEFRAMGNRNYHRRFDEIEENVAHFVECMELACRPRARKKEFDDRVATILRGE